MNKYQKQARSAREALRRLRQCERKAAYPSERAAARPGMVVYQCPYCRRWHRAKSTETALRGLARFRQAPRY